MSITIHPLAQDRICIKCKLFKTYEQFNKLSRWCKECSREYYILNKEKCKESNKHYRDKNKDSRSNYRKQYYKTGAKNKNKNTRKELSDSYFKYQEQRNQDYKLRRKTDIILKLTCTLRSRLNIAIKNIKTGKAGNTLNLVGCTLNELKKHLEAQFTEGMNWSNHSLTGWHVDHIKPINTFDLTEPEQQKICFHYTNLRPLWSTDNLTRPSDGSDISSILNK